MDILHRDLVDTENVVMNAIRDVNYRTRYYISNSNNYLKPQKSPTHFNLSVGVPNNLCYIGYSLKYKNTRIACIFGYPP